MLKSKITKVLKDGTQNGEREIMILEEGETLESVRYPEKRQEVLALVESLKVEFNTNCTPRIPSKVSPITSKVVITYKQDSNQIYRPLPFEKASASLEDTGTDAILTEKYTAIRDQFLQMLLDNFLPTSLPTHEELMAEIRQLLREEDNPINVDTCYNATFAIYAVHMALKRNSLPMVDGPVWGEFSRNYTNLVMGE